MTGTKQDLKDQIVATAPGETDDPMMIDDSDLDQMIGGMSLNSGADSEPRKAASPIYSGDPLDPIVYAPRPKPKPKP